MSIGRYRYLNYFTSAKDKGEVKRSKLSNEEIQAVKILQIGGS